MKNYIFKFGVEFDGDIFEKDCVKQTEKWIPFRLNLEKEVGKVKIAIDEIGCFVLESTFVDNNFKIPERLGIGFQIEKSSWKNKIRTIEKCDINEICNYNEINQLINNE